MFLMISSLKKAFVPDILFCLNNHHPGSGIWVSQSEEHLTLDLKDVSSSLTLGTEITYKILRGAWVKSSTLGFSSGCDLRVKPHIGLCTQQGVLVSLPLLLSPHACSLSSSNK